MIHEAMPEGFSPKFSVVSCFMECSGRILLLKRRGGKEEGGAWGVPAGKIDEGEGVEDAIVREIGEETGIIVEKKSLAYREKLYVRYPGYDFIFHIFHIGLEKMPQVRLREEEHTSFLWASPQDALKLSLVTDEDACIRRSYNIR